MTGTATAPSGDITPVTPASEGAASPQEAPAPVEADSDIAASDKTAAGDPAEPQKAEGDDSEATKTKKRSFQERIDQLTAQRREAEARAASAESQLRRMHQSFKDPDPNASFEDQEAARIADAVRRVKAEDVAADYHQAAAAEQRIVVDQFRARAEGVSERMPGLFDQFCSLPVVSREIASFVAESDRGAEVAYKLVKEPQLAAQISRMQPHRQAVELARLYTEVSPPVVKRSTNAPPPPTTIQGARSAAAKQPAEMTMAEYVEWRKKRS